MCVWVCGCVGVWVGVYVPFLLRPPPTEASSALVKPKVPGQDSDDSDAEVADSPTGVPFSEPALASLALGALVGLLPPSSRGDNSVGGEGGASSGSGGAGASAMDPDLTAGYVCVRLRVYMSHMCSRLRALACAREQSNPLFLCSSSMAAPPVNPLCAFCGAGV